MKPRIRYDLWLKQWACFSGLGMAGHGDSPKQAYFWWKWLNTHMPKAKR